MRGCERVGGVRGVRGWGGEGLLPANKMNMKGYSVSSVN